MFVCICVAIWWVRSYCGERKCKLYKTVPTSTEIRNFTTNCCFTHAVKNIPEQSFSLDVGVVCKVADE